MTPVVIFLEMTATNSFTRHITLGMFLTEFARRDQLVGTQPRYPEHRFFWPSTEGDEALGIVYKQLEYNPHMVQ